MTEDFLGAGNGVLEYILVLLVYGALFVVMRYANPRIEPGFRKTFWLLYVAWAFGTFIGNYAVYRLGFMSFLPWVNNFVHTFIWIGLCLGFLYAGCYKNPFWERFLLFAIFSFIVKAAERIILGTWEFNHFFFVQGNVAYIVGWSLMDGLYPVLSALGLRALSKYMEGIVTPDVF